jgi:uncharacterized Zn finger protein
MDNDRINDAVREFMGDNAPASELRVWRQALEERLNRLRAEAARDPQSREALRLKIEHLERQVYALREEEAITGFVEDTVRSAIADAGPVNQDSAPHESNIPPWASLDVDDLPEDY